MKKHLFFIATILFFTISCNGQKRDSEMITDVYNKYEIAISEKNMDKMVNCMSQETIIYFNSIVEKAKFSDSINLSVQSLVDKTLILSLRQTMTSDLLRKYTGKELMYSTLSKALNANNSSPVTELKEIDIKGDEATAKYVIDGIDTGSQINFKKEDANWKIDSSPTHNTPADNFFKQSLSQTGLSENVFIKYMVTNMSGSEMDDSIWHKTIK